MAYGKDPIIEDLEGIIEEDQLQPKEEKLIDPSKITDEEFEEFKKRREEELKKMDEAAGELILRALRGEPGYHRVPFDS